jgi:hypothetical protein
VKHLKCLDSPGIRLHAQNQEYSYTSSSIVLHDGNSCEGYFIGEIIIHLLVVAFIRPTSLNPYKLGFIKEEARSDEFYRVSRFLTSLISLRDLAFETVNIHYGVSPQFQEALYKVNSWIKEIFPAARVSNTPIEKRVQWEEIASVYRDNDVVLMTSNDDHALVNSDTESLILMEQLMRDNSKFGLGAITHFPEMQALIPRNSERSKRIGANLFSVPRTAAHGTVLVRGDLFKTWWKIGTFQDNEIVVRPDNPFGKSVSYPETQLLISNVEIMRHMDGYSHVYSYRPLPPLRNIVRFNPNLDFNEVEVNRWSFQYWPTRILSYSKGSCDSHLVTPLEHTLSAAIKCGVARLQAAWSFRICFSNAFNIVGVQERFNRIIVLSSVGIVIFTPSVARNIPDFLLDLCYSIARSAFSKIGINLSRPKRVEYHGWRRSSIISLFSILLWLVKRFRTIRTLIIDKVSP